MDEGRRRVGATVHVRPATLQAPAATLRPEGARGGRGHSYTALMTAKPIDWSQLWYPGPPRAFTPEEMARAGADAPSRTLLAMLALNLTLLTLVAALVAPQGQGLAVVLTIVLLTAGAAGPAWWLWWRPWRRPLNLACLAVAVAMLVSALLLRFAFPERESRAGLTVVFATGGGLMTLMLWFLVVWRSQQIESRLAAQAEREQAIEMARRLAAAQLEPHFLFNTLASLQHWVDTGDARASALLKALTGYLRATLPMFKRPQQALADELEAVERYLQVMQARLGARLDWHIEVEPALRTCLLPSGVLLTLVENAVQHGIEPSVAGGQVVVRARPEGASAVIEVLDDGPGPPPDPVEGVGLTNVRQRLALVAGPAAALGLARGPGGGCVARLTLPRTPA